MIYKVYQSHEIDPDLWNRIALGFTQAFDRPITGQKLKETAISNTFGFSYHAIAFDQENNISAYNSITPFKYKNNIVIGVSGGTYVLKEYRQDIFILEELMSALKKYCKIRNVNAFVGVPNKNSFDYTIKFNKFKYIGDLDYHILPIRISSLLNGRNIKFINVFSIIFSWFLLVLNTIILNLRNIDEKEKPLELDISSKFLDLRFQSNVYTKIENSKYYFSYRIVEENQSKVAYLMDFRKHNKRNSKALVKAIRHILLNEKIDAILFIGQINFKQFILIPIPEKFIPQRLPLTYFLLDKKNKELSNLLSEKKNWNFSLINFDVR